MASPGLSSPPAGCGASLVQKVQLRISCRNLLDKDITSRSDPCAVVCLKQSGKYKEVGRTEILRNTLDPAFTQTIPVEYHFEAVQQVRIRIYDVDNATKKLKDDDFLGQVKCTLAQIVCSSPFTSPLYTKHKQQITNSVITVVAEEVKVNKEIAMFRFSAKQLDNKDFLSKSDPFLEISRLLPDGTWQVIYRTEVVKNNLHPEWRAFNLDLPTLCSGDWSKPIRLTVFDSDKNGSYDLIGGATTSMSEMIKAISNEVTWSCIHEVKKSKKKNYTDSGRIILNSLQMFKEFSFLEYIFGGLQMNLTVAIDFTSSNGKPDDPKSLHHINPDQPNEYVRAITAVGAVLQDYDWDKLFPALGFGALIPPDMKESFEFPLNFNLENPFCSGVQGILEAYFTCLPKIQLYKPTKVAPVIQHVIRFAEDAQSKEATGMSYCILLILTDGVFYGIHDVMDALVQASGLPMSIIIVGVGQSDFTQMEVLDGDHTEIKSRDGRLALRDIVQFVPFRDFQNRHPSELASHLLAEIPRQVTDYYKLRRMPPSRTNYPFPVYPA
ncbi:copine-3-like [Biomphalaria glabrata]|uniref:Copine-3 n=1 Tax=Biomphalaria glabrata TaxID=6526 RepID=A0A9W3AYM6_BIOGL|nr:copine-3-like [Biomphalaria glabrata]